MARPFGTRWKWIVCSKKHKELVYLSAITTIKRDLLGWVWIVRSLYMHHCRFHCEHNGGGGGGRGSLFNHLKRDVVFTLIPWLITFASQLLSWILKLVSLWYTIASWMRQFLISSNCPYRCEVKSARNRAIHLPRYENLSITFDIWDASYT